MAPMFADAAVRHWTAASRNSVNRRNGAGIFGSPGGLAASLVIGTPYLPDPDAHRDAAKRAARWLAARTTDQARQYRERRQAGDLTVPWHLYDTISGMAGTGRVLLAAVAAGFHECEPGLLASLDTLTTMIGARQGTRPGWWLPASADPPGEIHPSGAATTGLAHGIAGPLAFLATAHAAGWTVAGQLGAIREAASWLLRWSTDGITRWPPHITGDELDTGTLRPAPGRRDAWCYGTPGISRALTLAGQALSYPHLTQVGRSAAASLADRPAHSWDTEGPALCHGYAGVLQSTATTSEQTAHRAAAAVTATYRTRHRFGFQDPANTGQPDQPGLLTGAAGIALALADHGNLPAPSVPTRWDAVLLLS